ncbi:hypothetical protein MMC34_008146 [Xylographa carneopallida]|nr:hypothetical protein [Xylographa carneopallida]
MTLLVLRGLPTRSLTKVLLSAPRRTFQPASCISRSYASTTSGTPNASNVGDNPQAVSSEASSVNKSRATDSAPVTDSASTATPVSQDNLQGLGEKSHDIDPVKQDPAKPAEEKAEHTEKQGTRPMGPEDHQ